MRQEAIALLKELTEAHSVPGHEDEVRAIFIDELGEHGELSSDRNGSVFCERGDGPRVMVAGHMDEVGFLVQGITADGFLQFVPVGGWWEHTLLAQRVEVLTRAGTKVPGVIGSRPPHFLPEAQRKQVLPVEQMFIDVGAASRREVEEDLGISLGDPVAPWSPFTALARDGLFMAKAFDNRVGMAAVIQAGKRLLESPRPNRLVLAGTVQEEVGTRGARTAAHRARPEVVVVLEGPPADDTPGFVRADVAGPVGRRGADPVVRPDGDHESAVGALGGRGGGGGGHRAPSGGPAHRGDGRGGVPPGGRRRAVRGAWRAGAATSTRTTRSSTSMTTCGWWN